MNYLLDSDVAIDYLNSKDSTINLLPLSSANNFFLSVISWLEISYGFKKSQSKKKLVLFEEMLNSLQIKIISVDINVARTYLDCRISLEDKKIPLADFDLFIAATALNNNLTLITRNIKHFKRITNLKLYS